ncbi:MAG: YjfB family protein [Azonexaceae bacterium]|uniref:YjfB family protein n=1 Tax=Azonexus sp. R2A61 TaxID=2744443 RepID=UPI001F48FD89|nr:YjfB family protein [Azonexus sp. R2A61]MCE1238831.1 YjfB family protein [Azonexaceae bacterium]
MDVSAVASAVSSATQARTGDAVNTLVLKKAMDIQAQTAAQLLQALPQASNPPHLGNSIDVKA